jgi:hypothetical protein
MRWACRIVPREREREKARKETGSAGCNQVFHHPASVVNKKGASLAASSFVTIFCEIK